MIWVLKNLKKCKYKH